MITLNILSPSTKKEIKFLEFYVAMKNIIFLLVVGISLVSIALLLAKLVLQNHFNRTVNQNYLSIAVGRYSLEEIKKFNEEIRFTSEIQDEFKSFTSLLIPIVEVANAGIALTNLEIHADSTVSLQGNAKTRQDLITFKNDVDISNLFEKFEIPLDILFQKEKINFHFNLKLKEKHSKP